MNSDIDYVVESSKRVLFKANKKDEINRTEGILSSDKTCFTWEAYIRVSDSKRMRGQREWERRQALKNFSDGGI